MDEESLIVTLDDIEIQPLTYTPTQNNVRLIVTLDVLKLHNT